MSGALPAFQCAADLGPSPSREAELEDICSRLAAENEQLRDAADQPVQQARPAQAGIKPEERQALIQLLSDLGKRVEDLERITAKQGKQIEDMQSLLTPTQQAKWLVQMARPIGKASKKKK